MRTKGGAKNPVRIVSGGLETTPKTQSDKYFPTNILDFSNAGNKGTLHPTQKPIDLVSWAFNKFALKSKLISDFFLGSGSTMVAAHQLNRKCYGMELDPKYCQVIIDRMIKLDPSLEVKRNGQPYKTIE